MRRSHALTLAQRGLGGVKGLGALESKVAAMEADEMVECTHKECQDELNIRPRRLSEQQSLAIVSK